MLIRFKILENSYEFNESRMIHCVDFKGDYAEYIKALKVVDSIYVDEYFYNLDTIAFNPAEDDDYVDCIDVYIREP
jgi:hypothetical protein